MDFRDRIPAEHREFLALLLVLMFMVILHAPLIMYIIVCLFYIAMRDWFSYS